MVDLICARSLTGVDALITDCGGDADAMFFRCGVDPAVIGSYDRFLPFSVLSALIGTCANELDVPDFGLQLARRQNSNILGPVAIAARNAGTVAQALQLISDFAHVYSPAISITFHESDHEFVYEFRTLLHRLPYKAHVTELAMGLMWASLKILGEGVNLTRVEFQHQRISEKSVYTNFFGTSVSFGGTSNLITLPRGILQRRLPEADFLTREIVIQHMADRNPQQTFGDAVTSLSIRLLPLGAATLANVSRMLMMHPRAVQRELSEARTTFEQLLDDARRELVTSLLPNKGVPLSTIAAQVGYSEQSTLSRSCRRWFGMSPLAKRRELIENNG